MKTLSLSNTKKIARPPRITKEEIISAQKAWADGVISIGNTYSNKGDYKACATNFIKDTYAYAYGIVLFKPTLASTVPFRTTFNQALSYFVGGSVSEDQGFAIRPWSKIRFNNLQVLTYPESALAMGNYFFTPSNCDKELKVEYTFGYVRDESGKLRINLHHSSLPFVNL